MRERKDTQIVIRMVATDRERLKQAAERNRTRYHQLRPHDADASPSSLRAAQRAQAAA